MPDEPNQPPEKPAPVEPPELPPPPRALNVMRVKESDASKKNLVETKEKPVPPSQHDLSE